LSSSRRELLKSLSRSALVLSLESVLGLARPLWSQSTPAKPIEVEPLKPGTPLGVNFVDVGRAAGLNARTIYGGEHKNKYLLETTGCGVAFYDYDNDGWLDIFLVNGTRLEGFPAGQEPVSHLFKNNRDGTFTDVTLKAGVARSGWGQGVCIGDYDNDGNEDLFVTYFGKNVLYHNNGDGTFTDVTTTAGVAGSGWATSAAWVDYDNDGRLDLIVARYLQWDSDDTYCGQREQGLRSYCHPDLFKPESVLLYHNDGNGEFTGSFPPGRRGQAGQRTRPRDC